MQKIILLLFLPISFALISLKLNKRIELPSHLAEQPKALNLSAVDSFFPVYNYFNLQYYIDVAVGNQSQRFEVIIDTGSNVLWLPSSKCVDCRSFSTKMLPTESTIDLAFPYNITVAF